MVIYIKNIVDFLEWYDILLFLIKGVVFGFIVVLMGCYYGMNLGCGVMGVGCVIKLLVVVVVVLIFVVNFILIEVLFNV